MNRRLFATILALFPALALAAWLPVTPGSPGDFGVYEVQGTTSPVTRSAPTVAGDGVLAGMSLAQANLAANQSGQHGLNVTVCAVGTTLSGAGTIKFYTYDPATPEWAAVPDLTQNVTATGSVCQTFLGLAVVAPRGRFMAVATGVTFAAGSGGVTVYLLPR